jgi:transcription elongation factor GreA
VKLPFDIRSETLERIPVNPEGYAAIRRELENLKRVERPENIRAIEEARSHGDLSENAEYAAAKDRQGFIEGRIIELEYKMACLEIIHPHNLPKDRAVFGSRVRLGLPRNDAPSRNLSQGNDHIFVLGRAD